MAVFHWTRRIWQHDQLLAIICSCLGISSWSVVSWYCNWWRRQWGFLDHDLQPRIRGADKQQEIFRIFCLPAEWQKRDESLRPNAERMESRCASREIQPGQLGLLQGYVFIMVLLPITLFLSRPIYFRPKYSDSQQSLSTDTSNAFTLVFSDIPRGLVFTVKQQQQQSLLCFWYKRRSKVIERKYLRRKRAQPFRNSKS